MREVINAFLPFFFRFKWISIMATTGGLAWVVCYRWKAQFQPAWLYIAGTVIATGLVLLLAHLAKKAKASKAEAGLTAGIAAGPGAKVDLKGEIKALRENWIASVSKLKAASKGGTGNILSRLPWYVIIGEPASGKSTLLRKSGLDFPVGDASVAGMHGTRNCDWWFANEAIFLDTAGRYIIETQESEWVTFLGLLKKFRDKKPINGVLVALPANTLLTKSDDELKLDGKRIRQRLDELIANLGINFPVYLLVTKCDLVGGFAEFFGKLDQRYAEQMVGWTNPAEAEARFDPEVFGKKFENVTERIYRMRPWTESMTAKRDLLKTFLYPEEFRYLKGPLRTVLEVVFRVNVYQETPICRGVYFSSGTQVGDPLARALEDMARDLRIPGDFGMSLGIKDEKEVRAYFIKDLVSDQILRDQQMSWRTRQADEQVLARRRKWGIIGLAAAVLLGIFCTLSWSKNRGRLEAFEVSIAEDSRPLQTSVGCLDARDAAKPPTFLDIGLNYMDQIRPSAERAFRRVFGAGCVAPIAAELRDPLSKGMPKGPDGAPEVRAYLEHYRLWLVLKRTLVDRQALEKAPLESFFGILDRQNRVGKAGPAELDRCLREFSGGAIEDYYSEKDWREADILFLDQSDGLVASVEDWVRANQSASGRLMGSIEETLKSFKDECLAQRPAVVPHKTPEVLVDIARSIRGKTDPLTTLRGGTSGKPLTALVSGIKDSGDLSLVLRDVKALLPEDPKARNIPARIDSLLTALGSPDTREEMDRKSRSVKQLRAFIDQQISDEHEALSYGEGAERNILLDRQGQIRRQVAAAGVDAWTLLAPEVKEIEGRDVEKPGEDGKPIREDGWWETLVLLAEARRADLLGGEYVEFGLIPWLSRESWRKERSGDRDFEVFTRQRIESLVLPRLREQNDLFADRRFADSIRESSLAELTRAFSAYIDDLDRYWLGQFEDALPKDAPADITAIQDRLRPWTSERLRLLSAASEIKDALTGIGKLEAPETDPLAAAQAPRLDKVFRNFVIFFDARDAAVRRHYTMAQGVEAFGRLGADLDPVAAGAGASQRTRARELASRVVGGAPGASSFALGRKSVREFASQADFSRPSGLIAERMQPLVENAWRAVIGLTADDINDEWTRRSSVWVAGLRKGEAEAFRKAFGAGGEIPRFEQEFLAPFFKLPGYDPLPTEGPGLVIADPYRAFMSSSSGVTGDLFDAEYAIRKNRITMGIKVAGETPTSLKVEYRDRREGPKVSAEKRTDPVDVEFSFEWTPASCEALTFIIGFRDGSTKTIQFTGPWAVAEAFSRADSFQAPATYVWTRTDPNLGRYGVELTVRGNELGGLYGVYRKMNGKDPLMELAARLPARIVEVR
jgi:hypothetical protein